MLDIFFVRIADIDFAIFSVDPALSLQIQGANQNFLISEATADVIIEARWDDLSKRLEGKKVFDSGSLWQLYNYNGRYLFSFTSPAFGSVPYKVAIVDKDFMKCEILLHRPYFDTDQPVYPLEYPLDVLLFIT